MGWCNSQPNSPVYATLIAFTGHIPNSIFCADNQGNRLLESAVDGSASLIIFDNTDLVFGPAIAKTPH